MPAARGNARSSRGRPAVERPDQVAADVAESAAAELYMRRHRLAHLLGDAVRRAEAQGRLDAALRLLPPPRD